MKVVHIDDFEKSGLHADFGELGETEVDVAAVVHDALKESAADFVTAKLKKKVKRST